VTRGRLRWYPLALPCIEGPGLRAVALEAKGESQILMFEARWTGLDLG
jgi:hypothetical protein